MTYALIYVAGVCTPLAIAAGLLAIWFHFINAAEEAERTGEGEAPDRIPGMM